MTFFPFPLLWSFRPPRRLTEADRIRNVGFFYGSRAFAGMQWRAAR
jgi:hypothetical protein